jgi:MFS family permease
VTTTSDDIVRTSRRDYVLMAAVLVAVMAGGTLPIPLYVLYERQMGFGPLGVTVVFAVYVVGTLAALLAFGDLSDHVGRRKLLAVAVACAMVSTALFLVASGVGLLIVARVISGLASGFATGTATAALAELQPRGDRRAAAVIASGANMTGLGLGPLVAGIFAAYVATPTRTVFWAYLGVCALALVALAVIAETVHEPDGIIRVRAGLGVPLGMRAVMAGACLGIFAAFSILGTFSSLVPTFLHGILAVRNLALIGAASFLIFIIAAITQAVSARHRGWTHLPRQPQRTEPAGRGQGPGRRRVHLLRRRLPRPGPSRRPDRPHLPADQHGGRQRLHLRARRCHCAGGHRCGAAHLRHRAGSQTGVRTERRLVLSAGTRHRRPPRPAHRLNQCRQGCAQDSTGRAVAGKQKEREKSW